MKYFSSIYNILKGIEHHLRMHSIFWISLQSSNQSSNHHYSTHLRFNVPSFAIHQKTIGISLKDIRWKFSIRKGRLMREARDPRRMRSIVVSFRNGAKCRRHNSEWLRTANYWATRPLAASLHHYCACIGALVWLFVGGVEGLTRQIMASSLKTGDFLWTELSKLNVLRSIF